MPDTVVPIVSDAEHFSNHCPLLSLPPELREHIYHFAFSPSTNEPKVDPLQSPPPDKGLLLACKQFYAEAGQIYKAAYGTYWTESDFILDYDPIAQAGNGSIKQALLPHKTAIEHITHFQVVTHGKTWNLVHPRGGWGVTMADGSVRYMRMRVSTFRRRVGEGDNWRYFRDHTYASWDGASNESVLRATCDRVPSGLSLMDQIRLLPTTCRCDVTYCSPSSRPASVPAWEGADVTDE